MIKCDTSPILIPDPKNYDLPDDYIYVELEWGSLFYKHLGKKNRTDAKSTCLKHNDKSHLPIPRFSEENDFFRSHFGDETLWLGVSNSEQTGIYRTDFDFTLHQIFKINGTEITGSKFEWSYTNYNNDSSLQGVKMSKSGQWENEDEHNLLHAICIYDIIPDECSECLNENFCRFKNSRRAEVECICPVMTKGDKCEKDLCQLCSDEVQCLLNTETGDHIYIQNGEMYSRCPRMCFELHTDPSIPDSIGDEIRLSKNGDKVGTALGTNQQSNTICINDTSDGDVFEFRNSGKDNVSRKLSFI